MHHLVYGGQYMRAFLPTLKADVYAYISHIACCMLSMKATENQQNFQNYNTMIDNSRKNKVNCKQEPLQIGLNHWQYPLYNYWPSQYP